MKNPKTEFSGVINDFNRKVGEIVFLEREKKGMNQSQLAKLIGVDRTIISRIENGMIDNLPAYYLPLISKALDFSPSLFFEDESMEHTLKRIKEILDWKAKDTISRLAQAEKSYDSKIQSLENENTNKNILSKKIVITYQKGEPDIIPVDNYKEHGIINTPDARHSLSESAQKYNTGATPFDFGNISSEISSFNEADKKILSMISSFLESEKNIELLQKKKPLQRGLIDYIVDNCLLEAAKEGNNLSMRICAYLSQLYREAWKNA